MIIMEYYEQLYIHTFNNFEKIKQSFENYKLQSLNLNSPITINEIVFVIWKLQKRKS